MISRQKFCAYHIDKPFNYPVEGGMTSWQATQDVISRLFQHDEKKFVLFNSFLKRGYRGWFQSIGDKWVTYGWAALPTTTGPIHLPEWMHHETYWIFYCRTEDSFQGRGLYKRSLSLIVNDIYKNDPNAQIEIDTETSNLPSRRAIMSVGFIPSGVINLLTLKFPYLPVQKLGSWDRNAPHPVMPTREGT